MNLRPSKLSRLGVTRLSVVTLVSVYVLILVGGIVRSTGSGMGCPDWPKCFGQWVPPTEAGQLPANYQEIYSQQRAAKNERFANYLGAFGFAQLADQIKNDPSILEEEDFNATKTWIEYLNRLMGAVVGLLILATFLVSLRYWNRDRWLVGGTFATLVTVALQGWIGSVVVSTNLLPWMITVHMLLALLIVALLTFVVLKASRTNPKTIEDQRRLKVTLGVLLVLTLVQIVMGTQVRESVNEVAATLGETQRERWIDSLDWVFYVHRSYSIILLLGHVYLAYTLYRKFWAKRKLNPLVSGLTTGSGGGNFERGNYGVLCHSTLCATRTFGIGHCSLWLTSFYSVEIISAEHTSASI